MEGLISHSAALPIGTTLYILGSLLALYYTERAGDKLKHKGKPEHEAERNPIWRYAFRKLGDLGLLLNAAFRVWLLVGVWPNSPWILFAGTLCVAEGVWNWSQVRPGRWAWFKEWWRANL